MACGTRIGHGEVCVDDNECDRCHAMRTGAKLSDNVS